ncbi:hypothetical protein O6H91_07G107900 [Diphasiastrum complanatum]|uniref:Uncharacterized protein n=1 Tax=Diphasiastrum complanatum TaxID=34168 RepID=A0ACC2D8J2_DIPCM|nr:hypothetical protein O6H91_07G107900 [Diphasiastrum complanatum]
MVIFFFSNCALVLGLAVEEWQGKKKSSSGSSSKIWWHLALWLWALAGFTAHLLLQIGVCAVAVGASWIDSTPAFARIHTF